MNRYTATVRFEVEIEVEFDGNEADDLNEIARTTAEEEGLEAGNIMHVEVRNIQTQIGGRRK